MAGNGGFVRGWPRRPFERLEQRGLLAADVGAGAAVEDDRDVAEELLRAHLLERGDEHLELRLVLAADVDEDVRRLDRAGGDQRPLEEPERDAEHDLAVLERARLRLVGVDHEVVRLVDLVRLRDEAPLAAGREEGAAAAAQVRGVELLDDLVRASSCATSRAPGSRRRPRSRRSRSARRRSCRRRRSQASSPSPSSFARRSDPAQLGHDAAARRRPARAAGAGCRSRRSSPSRTRRGTRPRAA